MARKKRLAARGSRLGLADSLLVIPVMASLYADHLVDMTQIA